MRYCYSVVSPTMEVTEYVPGLGGGPTFDVTDHVFVAARSKRDAVAAAVRHWLRRCPGRGFECCWVHYQRRDGASPYTGVRAYLWETV